MRYKYGGFLLFLGLLSACDAQFVLPEVTGVDEAEKTGAGGQPVVASSQTPGQHENRAPVVHTLTHSPSNTTVRSHEKITLNVVATDADSDTLSYTWAATQGTLSSTSGLSTQWSPVDGNGVLGSGDVTVSVWVSDGKNVSKASVTLHLEEAELDDGFEPFVPIVMPSPSPTPTSAPTPSWTPTEDVWDMPRPSCNGFVFDDKNLPLKGVTITARSLNSSIDYQVSTTTSADGSYIFNNVPSGIQVEFIASFKGYTSRRRVEVVKSNSQGDRETNRYDFGTAGEKLPKYGVDFNALSDKPEVIQVMPGRNASGIEPNTALVLTFSEPMDRNSVVRNFRVLAYTSEQFTVDDKVTLVGSSFIGSEEGDLIWDKTAFEARWNAEDTELTMRFKEEQMLPTDRDSDRVPDYQVSLTAFDGQLRDKAGTTRASTYFKLTDGNFEQTYKFSINTDEEKPRLAQLTASSAEGLNTTSGDTIKVRFSERMIHYTASKIIAGGMNGHSPSAAGDFGLSGVVAAENYQVSVAGAPAFQWSDVGSAVFDASDLTHKTVLLLPRDISAALFSSGDTLEVRVATTVLDPAGNSVDAGGASLSTIVR